MATANEKSADYIRKGVIYNLDKTTQSLTSIIKKLETALKASIGKVYVGIAGQSLRTIRNTEVRHLDEEIKISQELIDSLMDSNRTMPIVGYQILGVAPQEYKVGLDMTIDPVGVQTDHIEARFLNIIARSSIKLNINQCFEQATIGIADDSEDIIAPLALADAVLTPNENRSGCVLVDMGADTTTVQIYKNNLLRHLAVIPLGGNNITKDICSQQIEEEDAESLKLRFAKAHIEPSEEDDENKVYQLDNRCSIKVQLFEDIVEARQNEILDNILNQVVLSGYENKLLAGAILTGGAANMPLMDVAFTKRTKIEKVRIAKETQYTLKGVEISKDGRNNTLIAFLANGKENCCLAIPEVIAPKPVAPKPTVTKEPLRSVIEAQLFDEEGESMERVSIRVPATSANLGPGFDSLGMAVGLFDTVRIRTNGSGRVRVTVQGEGAAVLPTDETHLIARTIIETVHNAGYAAGGFDLECENVIPHGRGLGSSASAIVSGVLAGNALLPADAQLDPAGLLHSCSALEGHPDNVAPALSGGLAVSWEEEGRFRSVRTEVHPDIIPVVAIPATELSTESARGLLPAQVPHRAAAANSGRSALLIHALAAQPSMLLPGTVDYLHQDYRAAAMEPSAALVRHLRENGVAAVISGAGPTVMALAAGQVQAQEAQALITGHLEAAGTTQSWRVLRLSVDRDGARVEGHLR